MLLLQDFLTFPLSQLLKSTKRKRKHVVVVPTVTPSRENGNDWMCIFFLLSCSFKKRLRSRILKCKCTWKIPRMKVRRASLTSCLAKYSMRSATRTSPFWYQMRGRGGSKSWRADVIPLQAPFQQQLNERYIRHNGHAGMVSVGQKLLKDSH